MALCQTKEFGPLEYDEAAVVEFPGGLPAFERERGFLLIERTETAPVVFLQSLTTPQLLFIALPARFVDAGFQVALLPEECETLGLAADGEPREGEDMISLALLTMREGAATTANLLAPVVIGARSRRALQIVQPESGYRIDHPLTGTATVAAPPPPENPACL